MADDPSKLESLATKLRDKIFNELSNMDSSNEIHESSSQDRLKSYTGFFKLLQSLEEMIQRVEHERDKKLDRGVDILEFRRQLEEQIARLVDQSDEKLFLNEIDENSLETLNAIGPLWARLKQRPPLCDWRTWLILGGEGGLKPEQVQSG